jgi:hypothetical protein
MPERQPTPATRRNPDSPADQALTKIIDLLLKDGYGFTIPAWDGDAYLKISNALGALTDLTISSEGHLTWDYRSIQGLHVDPAELVVITISLLDPDAKNPRPDLPPHSGRVLIHVGAGDALLRYGLTTSRQQPEPDGYTILTITNPAQPTRGTVEITDDGQLTWHTRAPHHLDSGLTLPDIAATLTLTRALTRTQHTPSNGQRRTAELTQAKPLRESTLVASITPSPTAERPSWPITPERRVRSFSSINRSLRHVPCMVDDQRGGRPGWRPRRQSRWKTISTAARRRRPSGSPSAPPNTRST